MGRSRWCWEAARGIKIHDMTGKASFTGAVDPDMEEGLRDASVDRCTGKAGSACLMHSRLLHASLPNMTNAPRSLFIVTYVAEDAVPLSLNPIPHVYDGDIMRGAYRPGPLHTYEMDLPEYPKASFFGQQDKVKA